MRQALHKEQQDEALEHVGRRVPRVGVGDEIERLPENYPNEADRRKAIGRVKRFIGCGTGPFRFCTFAFSPGSRDQEGYKGVGWTLWVWQMVKIYNLARFLKDWNIQFFKA